MIKAEKRVGLTAALMARLGVDSQGFDGSLGSLVKLVRQPEVQSLIRRVFRYAIIGVLIAAIYNASVFYMAHYNDVRPVPASLIGYALTLPFAYVGHRMHTFNSHNRIVPE